MTLVNYSDRIIEETIGLIANFEAGRWYNEDFTRSIELDVEFVRNPHKGVREFHIRGMLEQYPLSEREKPPTFSLRVSWKNLTPVLLAIRVFLEEKNTRAQWILSDLHQFGQVYPTAEMIVVPDTKTVEVDRIVTLLEWKGAAYRERAMRALRSLCSDTVDGCYDIADGVLAKADPTKMTTKAAKGLAIVTWDDRDNLPHWLDYARRVSSLVGPFNANIEAVLQANQNTLDKP